MIVRRRKLPSGAARWEMDYTLGGKRSRKTVPGTDGKTLKKEAEALARAWFEREASRTAGLAVAEPMTLGELLERDRGRAGASEATREMIAAHGRPLFRVLGEATLVSAIGSADFERYKSIRLGEGKAARSINMELAHTLAPAMRRAWEDGLLPSEPDRPRRLPEIQKEIRWLSGPELSATIRAARTGANGRIQNTLEAGDCIEFLANTGLRRGEFCGGPRPTLPPGFCWRDVDFDQAWLWAANRKRGRGVKLGRRRVPLNATALAILKRRRPEDAAAGDQAFAYVHRLNQWIKAAAREAGLEGWERVSAHSLRHTFATLTLQGGANIRDVAALLGDSVETTARVYLHESQEGMRSGVQSLERWSIFGAHETDGRNESQ